MQIADIPPPYCQVYAGPQTVAAGACAPTQASLLPPQRAEAQAAEDQEVMLTFYVMALALGLLPQQGWSDPGDDGYYEPQPAHTAPFRASRPGLPRSFGPMRFERKTRFARTGAHWPD